MDAFAVQSLFCCLRINSFQTSEKVVWTDNKRSAACLSHVSVGTGSPSAVAVTDVAREDRCVHVCGVRDHEATLDPS